MEVTKKFSVITPADWIEGPGQGRWTYSHYAAMQEDGYRYEVIDGVLYALPSTTVLHQSVAGYILYYLIDYIQIPDLGRIYGAPFDVELAPNVVVQPDVLVVLRSGQEKITYSHVIGAPDLVVEVSWPSTTGHDRREKQDAYARAHVREYWIVDATAQTVEVLFLEDRIYHSQGIFTEQSCLVSQVVPTIAEIPVEKFFL